MSYKILDYMTSYIEDISRVSDIVNVGVSVNGFTRSDGKVSKDPTRIYSDDDIQSTFITTEAWSTTSIPKYIEIGEGRLTSLVSPSGVISGGSIVDNSFGLMDKSYYQDPEQIEYVENGKGSITNFFPAGEVYAGRDDGVSGEGGYGGIYAGMD
jgi:hypothetical protein